MTVKYFSGAMAENRPAPKIKQKQNIKNVLLLERKIVFFPSFIEPRIFYTNLHKSLIISFNN